MFRPGSVALAASVVVALALIALTMGLLVEMPPENAAAGAPRPATCGHVLDATYRHGPAKPGCSSPLRKRRFEVAAAAGLAGAAAIVALTAMSRSLGSPA